MKNINDDKARSATPSLGVWWKRYQFKQHLNMLDDRILADIGVRRDEIAMIAEKSYPRVRFFDAISALIGNLARSWSNREIERKLSNFDDHILADIGLSRSDLSVIGQGRFPERRGYSSLLMDYVTNAETETRAINDDHRRAA